MVQQIDMNADLGESFAAWNMGDDAAVMRSISSANIACGFHAGDPRGIALTCREAVAAGVGVGAHVGYRDLVGFGRRFLDMDPAELADEVLYQIGALDALARAAGGRVSYVKPHGALYNAIVRHEAQAQAVVDGVKAFGGDLPLLVLPGSAAAERARSAGLRAVGEVFADRGYTAEGTLVSRQNPGALLQDVSEVVRRMVRWVSEGTLTAVDGSEVRVEAESICLHGDTPGAVSLAAAVRTGLEDAGVAVRPFVP